MSIIGEAILTVSIDMLFKKLASIELSQFAHEEHIHADLKQWEEILVKIKAVLEDAEQKHMTEQSVKIWLGELQNLAYDVEDILDEFATEALRRKLLLEPLPNTNKVRKIIPTCCSSFNPPSFKFNSVMSSKIKKITIRLQDIAAQKYQLDLKDNSGGRSNKIRQKLPTTSLVNKAKIYGREKDKEAIVESLLRDDLSTDDEISVITVIGMGGVGKTTLAQLAYNDVRVENHFDLKAWFYVSEDFDVIKITKTILKSIAAGIGDDNDLNMLQIELKQQLFKKKFLLVLDDIWNENYGDWTVLRRPFEASTPGSKILVTTRNQGVSSVMSTIPAHSLKELSNDDCLCVFTQHSLGTRDFSKHQHLKEIGQEIVKKCKGLPLAVQSLGGLLRGKYDINDWKYVLNSKIWDLPEEKCDILPALRISYHFLPSHLKRFFAYCSIFPKGYEFQENEIILLWMAEGFLQHEITEMQFEELGHKYFCELQSRSFFQQSSRNVVQRSFFQQSSGNFSLFAMHELISELAQWAAGETCLRLENVQEGNKQGKVSKNVRHLSCTVGSNDGFKSSEDFYDFVNLRTLLPMVISQPRALYGCSSRTIHHILSKLRHLRVLSLHNHCISELLNGIGDLTYLRYLDLSSTNIETLPDSVGSLYNLQTLNLANCTHLRKLCTDMGNLINLRHLNISAVNFLEQMPLRIGKLTDLQTLPKFVVGKSIGNGLGELKSLIHLRETLSISNLENVNDVADAKEANLNSKRNLNVLLLNWTSSIEYSRNTEMETHVLEILQPHQKLAELTIKGYGGKKFPTWLGNSSFSNLVRLRFENCYNSTTLPPVGQLPSLKDLDISGMAVVKRIGAEFYGNGCFPSLRTLCFANMEEWEDWLSYGPGQNVEGFPQLRELSIIRCSKLQGRLPGHLPSLERLLIQECKQFLLSVPSLPSLQKLEIDGCKEVVWRSTIDLSSLNSVILSDINNMFLAERFIQRLPKLEEMKIVDCEELISFWQSGIRLQQDVGSLRVLVIERCNRLISLVVEEGDEQQQQWIPSGLQCLRLIDCECFVKLPQALHDLSSLRELSITNCPKLVSFPEVGLPSHLRFINIRGCDGLESLPQAWMHSINISLETLYIEDCAALTYIFRVQVPPSLRQLTIRSCNNLGTLVDEEKVTVMHEESCSNGSSRNTSTLEILVISHCPNLTALTSRGNLPNSLKYLSIYECSKLESVAEKVHGNTSLECIEKIYIRGCPNLVSFPRGLLSTKLTDLVINDYEKLEALPNCMPNLISLQELSIRSCPGIVTFPDGGFPTNLTSIQINHLKICKALFEWGLHRLTSLRRLDIKEGCEDIMTFPQEEIGMILPTSLTHLSISHFPNLKCLSSLVQSLTSLEELYLRCAKLKSFPENGLPPSLLKLYIYRCPLLKQRCKKDKGRYWPIIAEIPNVVL